MNRPDKQKDKVMNDQFDELAKGLAQSVTRRGALKKFGLGLAGGVLASLGLANNVHADKRPYRCRCGEVNFGCERYPLSSYLDCVSYCGNTLSRHGGCGD